MRVAICDDQKETAQCLETLLISKSSLFEVDIFYTPRKLLAAINDGAYDFLFLDIEMPGMSGIEVAEEIRKIDAQIPLVFLTSYKQYMPEVFSLQTFDYLLKPITKEKLLPVIDRIIKYLAIEDRYFLFEYKKVSYKLPLSTILYFEKEKRMVLVHTTTGVYKLVMKTSELLQHLTTDFIQIHHSYIVNSRYITQLTARSLLIENQEIRQELPISRKFTKTVREQFLNQLKEIM